MVGCEVVGLLLTPLHLTCEGIWANAADYTYNPIMNTDLMRRQNPTKTWKLTQLTQILPEFMKQLNTLRAFYGFNYEMSRYKAKIVTNLSP